MKFISSVIFDTIYEILLALKPLAEVKAIIQPFPQKVTSLDVSLK